MPTPAAPRRNPSSPAQLTGLVIVLVLAVIALVQCTSPGVDGTPTPAGTETSAPSSAPGVEQESATPPPASTPVPHYQPAPMPEPEIVPEPAPQPAPNYSDDDNGGSSSAYYKNCSEARAAGVTPLHAGEPGYSSKLDRDGDGVACE